ncbi:hypothetical protein [Aestuariivirga sp.]|uniref:hypothetical protein n=1 Tax=Aestuariivirga sp. TaxID=2650926 RepID=UPI0035938428
MGIGDREGPVDDPAVLAIGMGGYIGGRSLEKVAGIVTAAAGSKVLEKLPGRQKNPVKP